MDDEEWLSRTDCFALLRTASTARVAYSERALPAIATVPFAVLDETILVRTDAGSPLATTLGGAVVAFQAGEDSAREGWNVTCVGRASPFADSAELAATVAAHGWLPAGDYFQIDPELLRGRRSMSVAVSL